MATTPSIANIIDIMKISKYLASKAIALGQESDSLLPTKLYVEGKSIEWMYDNDSTDDNLQKNAWYGYGLCGLYGLEAQAILGTSGGIVSLTGSGANVSPFPINVTITAGQAGVSTLQNSAWIGLEGVNQVVINQNVLQSNDFSFNSATGTFDFSAYGYVLQTGDEITSYGFMPTT